MPVRYAELHALSNFTFLRGASHPEELVETAATLGYEALATTSSGHAGTLGHLDGSITRDVVLEHCRDVDQALRLCSRYFPSITPSYLMEYHRGPRFASVCFRPEAANQVLDC